MINILPHNQTIMIRRIRYMRIATFVLWGSTALLVAAAVLLLPTLRTIDSRYAIAIAQTDQLERSGAIVKAVDVAALELRTASVKKKLAAVLPLSPTEYVDHVRVYETIAIRLTGYEMTRTDKPVMQVRGVALTRQSLQQFVERLQADPSVATVDSPVANFVKSGQSDFTLTVTFKTS